MLPARGNQNSVIGTGGAFSRALARFRVNREQARRIARIGFIVDATGSREASWEQAQTVQARMFATVSGLSRVAVRLVHFGGGELTDHGWSTRPRALAARMAAVRCRTGLTQILPALRAFLDDGERAGAVILVGDAFEESADEAEALGLALKNAGIRVFSFLEGYHETAEAVFRRLARITGGRFARLGDELPLGDLCEGVVLLAAGGETAVRAIKNERVKRLLLAAPSK